MGGEVADRDVGLEEARRDRELGQRPGQPGDEVVDHDRVEPEVRGQLLIGREPVLGEAADPGDLGAKRRLDDAPASIAVASTARSGAAEAGGPAPVRLAPVCAAISAACSRNRAIS